MRYLLACILLLFAADAPAMNVTLDMTLPALQAASCTVDLPDSCTTLQSVLVYQSSSLAITDSTLLSTTSVVGQYGKPFTVVVNAQPGSYLWCITRDVINRSCRSNVIHIGGGPKRITDLRGR